MHLIDADHHVLGASAVVGTTIPIAVGYSLALKREGKGRVAVVFFGDGGTEEGVFHESLNFAALQKLPVLFVCENNFYAIHTPIEKRWATRRLCERVSTYGIPTNLIDNNDVMQIRGVCGERVAAMREGSGPAFVEIHTYRWREHVGPGEDYNAGYRGVEELRKWQEKDQVALVGQQIDPEVRKRIDSEVDASIRDAVEFAENAAWPAPEELLKHVFAE
jgi:pyruvate dehydrogenase E1 component alpha subunit